MWIKLIVKSALQELRVALVSNKVAICMNCAVKEKAHL